jgi:Alcohol dehydrogenase transcription factor Myb/SANT-like
MDAFSASLTERPNARVCVHSVSKMNINTERVISEVQLRPALWDLSSPIYKDRDAKMSAWREICNALFHDFEDKPDSEKKDVGK